MKKRSGFIISVLLVFAGLTSCVDPPIIVEELPTSMIFIPKRPPVQDSTPTGTPNPVPGTHQIQKVFTTYVAIISGKEAVSGFLMRNDIPISVTAKGVCWSTSPDPTINDDKVEDASSNNISHYHITGLELNTTYYLRTYIVNSGNIEYGDLRSFTTPMTNELVVFNSALTYGSLTDIDGNIYKTIQIGTQTWMAENLKTTKYSDGSQIPNITDNSQWINLKTGAYRWYENEETTFKNLYGAMYNWYAVDTRRLCPTGWHVPGDEEWKTLEIALGMTQAEADSWGGEEYGDIGRGTDQGNRMRATIGWSDWEGINGNGTNTSGFSALPGGDTGWYGWYEIAGQCTSWWTSMEAVARVLGSGDGKIGRAVYSNHIGFSVRCLKN